MVSEVVWAIIFWLVFMGMTDNAFSKDCAAEQAHAPKPAKRSSYTSCIASRGLGDAERYALLYWRLMTKIVKVVFLLFSLALQTAVGESRIEFRDFSQKGTEYKSLENLRFAAADVTYSGDEQINILSKPEY